MKTSSVSGFGLGTMKARAVSGFGVVSMTNRPGDTNQQEPMSIEPAH